MSTVEPVEPASPTTTAPAEADPFTNRTHDSLVDEVRTLRKENEDKRKRYAPVADAFDGMSDEVRGVLTDFAKAVKTGDNQSITGYVAAWADQFGISKAEVKEAIADAQDDADKPLTAKDLRDLEAKLKADQQAALTQRDTEALAGRVTSHAEKLGYSFATDPVAMTSLINNAIRIQVSEKLDAIVALDKAHTALEERDQRLIDKFVSTKGQEARRVPAPSTSGSAPTKDTTPKNLKEADAALKERLRINSR